MNGKRYRTKNEAIYSEQKLRAVLGRDLAPSPKVDAALREAYILLDGRKQPVRPKRPLRRLAASLCAAAVLLGGGTAFCITNPVIAAQIPLIGRIFASVEQDISHPGDYSSRAEPLAASGSDGAAYVRESGDLTVTFSEAYYDSMALYLSVRIESAEGFPPDFILTENLEGYQWDYDTLRLISTASIFPSAGQSEEFEPVEQIIGPDTIEGKFTDSHTFDGVLCVDLAQMRTEDGEPVALPDSFQYRLSVTQVWSELFETKPVLTRDPDTGGTVTVEEPVIQRYSGDWEFTFDVTLDTSETVRVAVNDTNEDGIGIGMVEKSSYTIQAELLLPEGAPVYDYFVAICDKDNRLLDFREGNTSYVYDIYGRDVSEVHIYVCDYVTYMDECKAENYRNLPKKALYQTTVTLTE
ncbi:MAG TPA: DUF4179 domain-containing protein [Candidatus Gallacutalibacter pullicola]|uniref:DUF4179 domain-containing protein n=1 Tax=Candidatus Gallacutalibacter pullicola TaxID=2840830 RepID=A0A9D1DPC8_9FIRM|nr:DUF4179 domain-containing protein [Candidatus Gallacutalibacter pullicola]